MRYFVTGYPRSRTAWLSVALTFGDHYCWHEGLVGCKSLDEFFDRIGPQDGNSDCGLPFVARSVAEKWPDARWVVIDRDPVSCSRSLRRKELNGDVSALTPHLDWIRDSLHPLVVSYKNIDRQIEKICEYCIDEIPPHLEALSRLRIEDRYPQEKVAQHIQAITKLLEDTRWDG